MPPQRSENWRHEREACRRKLIENARVYFELEFDLDERVSAGSAVCRILNRTPGEPHPDVR